MNSREKAAEEHMNMLREEDEYFGEESTHKGFLAGSAYEQARVKPVIDAVHVAIHANGADAKNRILSEALSKYQEGENGKV